VTSSTIDAVNDAQDEAMDVSMVPLILRAARRHADLSQRELASLSGVPASTIAAVETGRDVRVRVLDRLLAMCGWNLSVLDSRGHRVDTLTESGLRDRAGRRYPAHLDVRPVGERGDWWGDSFIGSWGVPPRPLHTYDLSRDFRDFRRRSRPTS
jgi:transcriptional regulator with XRE-family HTH domain